MKPIDNKFLLANRIRQNAIRKAREGRKWRSIERAAERRSLGLDEKTRSNAAIQKDLSRDPIAAAKAEAAFEKKVAASVSVPHQVVLPVFGAPSAQNDKAADFGAKDWCPRRKNA